MADDGENMFGRDSDSDSSEEAEDVEEAAVNTEEHTAPTGGGAAGDCGFLGQVEKSVAKPEGSSGGGRVGGGGGATGEVGEGRAREVEEDVPPLLPETQGGAQPKKTLPRPVYEGKPAALLEMIIEAAEDGEELDIAKVRELLDAGIDILQKVRVSCVCSLVRVLTRTSECMDVAITRTPLYTVF